LGTLFCRLFPLSFAFSSFPLRFSPPSFEYDRRRSYFLFETFFFIPTGIVTFLRDPPLRQHEEGSALSNRLMVFFLPFPRIEFFSCVGFLGLFEYFFLALDFLLPPGVSYFLGLSPTTRDFFFSSSRLCSAARASPLFNSSLVQTHRFYLSPHSHAFFFCDYTIPSEESFS